MEMICHKYKCIFIHQRKNAGTAIINSFGYTPDSAEWRRFNEGALSFGWKFRGPVVRDYLVFAVARNPWERFISGWKYLPKYRNLSLDDVIEDLPQRGADYRHLTRPQLDTLVDRNNKFVADFVIRFETLEEDFRELCKLIGKPTPHGLLKKENTTTHNGLKEFTSQQQIDFVSEHFKKDIEYFSYTYNQREFSLK
jgi:hypothetical protein